MVEITEVITTNQFEKSLKSVRDGKIKTQVKKQIEKIISNPAVGKPLQYSLKGERTIYVKPYRIIYSTDGSKLFLLRFSHRDEAYRR